MNPSQQRIVAIDLLRGFALLGILLMNSIAFALPNAAYFNPLAYGGELWSNQLLHGLLHILADQKFMALFSLLFGASITMICKQMEAKTGGSAKYHYTRTWWLLVFGLLHSSFIWIGDVLSVYALVGFVLFFLRNWAPKLQFSLGLLIFFLPALAYLSFQSLIPTLDQASQQAISQFWQPSAQALTEDIVRFRGPYSEQMAYRQDPLAASETTGDELIGLAFMINIFARSAGMMLVGMALFSWGVLNAERSQQFYRRMAWIGLGFGLPIASLGLALSYYFNWDWRYSVFIGNLPNLIATPLIAGGYLALIMLWSRSALWTGLQARMVTVGRTALTHYIAQSVISTFIFYGFGLGLYGHLNRPAILLVVLAIWALQLLAAPWWLARFRYGPLEWLWRSLTYFSWQPLRR